MMGNFDNSRFNATRHGMTSRHVVLPWERPDEFDILRQALFWRKQRVLQAERAGIRDELRRQFSYSGNERTTQAALAHLSSSTRDVAGEAVRESDEDAEINLTMMEAVWEGLDRALRILKCDGDRVYERTLKALHPTTRSWWQEEIEPPDEEDDVPNYQADAESMQAFLEEEVRPWCASRLLALRHRPLIRSQAFGMAMLDASLDRLSRYETALDRKMQRILGMLLRLREVRNTVNSVSA